MKKSILFIFASLFFLKTQAQVCLNDIDLSKIPQQEIRDLLVLQQHNNIKCISDIEPTCSDSSKLQKFYKQIRTYNINDEINNVWFNYNHDSPAKVYNSGKFSFGLMLCKNNISKKIMYNNDVFGNLEQGQVIYLKLKFLKGLYKMAVAFEILSIDSAKKTIAFSYVKGGNKATGKQMLQFIDCKNGKTKIVHTSYYKSNFYLRDKIFYPFFHAKVTNEFHKNLRRIICHKTTKNVTSA